MEARLFGAPQSGACGKTSPDYASLHPSYDLIPSPPSGQ